MATFALTIESFYAASSSELGTVSYGACQDEAINNLQQVAASQAAVREPSDV